SLAIRTDTPAELLAPVLGARIREIDPQILVSAVRPMEHIVFNAVSRPFFNLLLVGGFALVAIALAAVGIYGVIAFLVTQRTRELGVRIALGAGRRHVVMLVLRQGLSPVVAGLVVGLVAAAILTRVIATMLFGVTPIDPLSFSASAITLLAVA